VIASPSSSSNDTNNADNNNNNDNDNDNDAAAKSKAILGADGKPIELALHLRDGCLVESVHVFIPACTTVKTTTTTISSGEGGADDVSETAGESKPIKRSKVEATEDIITNPEVAPRIDKKSIHHLQSLHSLPLRDQYDVSFSHHDPLSVVLTRPADLHSVEEDGSVYFHKTEAGRSTDAKGGENEKPATPVRYEADSHISRGTRGLTNSIRAASIASALGELRILIAPNKKKGGKSSIEDKSEKKIRLKVGGSRNSKDAEDGNAMDVDPKPQNVLSSGEDIMKSVVSSCKVCPLPSLSEAAQCWKEDLLFAATAIAVPESADDEHYMDTQQHGPHHHAAGETRQGTIERKMKKDVLKWRCKARRDARIELVAKSLAEMSTIAKNSKDSIGDDKEWLLSRAMKIVIKFSIRPMMVPPTSIIPTTSPSNDGKDDSLPADQTESSTARAPPNIGANLGGLIFVSPPAPPTSRLGLPNVDVRKAANSQLTPHVYTVGGTHGDHQGIRSWLPTLDSASSHHRASHELVIKVTSLKNEGLWPCASGEDFGHNQSVSHPILGCLEANRVIFDSIKGNNIVPGVKDSIYQAEVARAERTWNAADGYISKALGEKHTQFLNDFFLGSGESDDEENANVQDSSTSSNHTDAAESVGAKPEQVVSLPDAVPDTIPSSLLDTHDINLDMIEQLRLIRPTYVTSIFSSLVWTPCPSRSLGFAVGPFATLHDPEYFRLDTDDEDEDDNGMEDDDDGEENGPLSIHETARKLGEGIRQLYFAHRDDRPWIHANVSDELIFGPSYNMIDQPERPALSAARVQDQRLLEGSIIASTVGVPNRALSLMRDILALPTYRTSSYTQIWIPNAYMSGSSCGGNFVGCPEVAGCNPFLGGAIMDSTLLPPPGMRLPYYNEGKIVQFLQARNAIRGWVRAALPLGADDDIGQGYLHTMIETFIMSLYERAHGAFGEGGGKGSYFYTKRYAIGSGLNSPNLDFLPLANIEEDEVAGAVAIEERGNEHLWRSANNGTETHTSSLDEFMIGQLQVKDFIEALERNEKDSVPLPSMGWAGSHLSATFLSHNSSSSTALGCGALEFVHPVGGQAYRAMKTILLNRIFEGRAGISHFTRVIRAAFIASFLRDTGVTDLNLPDDDKGDNPDDNDAPPSRPPFVLCIEEIIKKQALTHTIFIRALRVMSGPIHEPYLRGNLVDIDRDNLDTKNRKLVEPEAFPNSYVRGASGLYMRVGVHVESADGSDGTSQSSAPSAAAVKGIHLHVVVEPVIPEGGSAFGGPVTVRVIENEGQCREFIKTIPGDGSRAEWGPIFLHARSVSTAKQQQAASGISDAPTSGAAGGGSTAPGGATGVAGGGNISSGTTFTSDLLHKGGFQALELIRLTNTTPLLWVRVDPHGLYNGRLNIFQQDACLAEQLFHDGDASGQVEAMRALAERPLRIQGTPKITNVHDVPISELPIRVLGDCLRGSVALHCDLPHTPAIRAQAALAIAQWQNNKAPESRDVVGGSAWLGLDLLMQYFKERYYNNGAVLPANFRRLVLHKNIAGGTSGSDSTSDGGYQYLDALTEKDERKNAIEFADEIEIEEDEEYRVRSACVTAIASVRAQDGMTPPSVLKFLEEVLLSGDKAAVGSLLLPHEEELLKKKQDKLLDEEYPHKKRIIGPNDDDVSNLPYVSFSLVAEALLALCHVNARPQYDFDPATGRPFQLKTEHPITPLLESCRGWLEWDLERERMRAKSERADLTGIGGACHASIAPCAITALCHLALLKQCTTASDIFSTPSDKVAPGTKRKPESIEVDDCATAQYYVDIFDSQPSRADAARAAAAQAVVCICCATDRDMDSEKEPLGLLLSLEFLLQRILEPSTSPGLRITLASLMMDACSGKICSLQRVGSFAVQSTFCASGSRYLNGPLGPSCGGDNGSALLLAVNESTYLAADAVNTGARRGFRILRDTCKEKAEGNTSSNDTILRVAKFAAKFWRTINGEQVGPASALRPVGVCAHDGHLRCALVSLWQWIWPKHCYQVMRAASWYQMYEGTMKFHSLGFDQVMASTPEEREACKVEDDVILAPLVLLVNAEIDRQKWRGEMAAKAYEYFLREKKPPAEIGQPLPIVKRDTAWKLGGWVASTAQQRRAMGADGGSAVTKIRLMVKNSSGAEV